MDINKLKQKILGLTVDEAKAAVAGDGVKMIRSKVVNGEGQMVSFDYREDRANVSVQDGKIVDLLAIG